MIRDQDQSAVIIRPKYYIGSCGSVWASDYMRLSHELPMLFQEASSGNNYSIEFRKLVTSTHDVVFYFVDVTLKEDVICATPQTGCQHYCYENEKLAWLVENQLDEIMRIWTEDKERDKESEEILANELLGKLVSIKENAASL